jgi:hypothetical protein
MAITKASGNAVSPAAKGDLVAGSATNDAAVLGVGANGETLVADSAATTGLRYQANFAAGKNKIINGDFGIWQRGTSFIPATSADTYLADRFVSYVEGSGTTRTISQQTFTPGTAPVAGYEGKFFLRYAQTVGPSAGIGNNLIRQKIEDVRTFANQTVTFSFWAKAAATTVLDSIKLIQNFGSGGSPSASVTTTLATSVSIGTSWERYTYTATLPSISGKTIGTNNDSLLEPRINFPLGSGNTFTVDTWGWQVEASNTATAFQTATGTLQGELAACQRYFYRTTFNKYQSWARDTNVIFFNFRNPVTMRSNPSVSTSLTSKVATAPTTAAQVLFYYGSAIAGTATLTLGTDSATTDAVTVYFSGATFTQGVIPTAEVAGGYFNVSSEL